jgi:hypothetical protein
MRLQVGLLALVLTLAAAGSVVAQEPATTKPAATAKAHRARKAKKAAAKAEAKEEKKETKKEEKAEVKAEAKKAATKAAAVKAKKAGT